MRKILFFVLVLIAQVFAQTQDFKILAQKVTTQNNKIFADGDVVVLSPKYLITAQRANYNRKTGEIELFGNVSVMHGIELYIRSNYVKINLKKDIGDFNPFFLAETKKGLWLKSEKGSYSNDIYTTDNAIVSSCNVMDPDWKIGFTKGTYNKKSSFVNVYNALFYAKDIPVFYLPYFGFSTDKTRRTGLLRPYIGYSKTEGTFYLQPIYVAEYVDWDLEFHPQIRTNRGEGLHTTFRFSDSLYSNGSIKFGGFKEKQKYYQEYNLKNQNHTGFEINYERTKLLSDQLKDTEDGLLIDFTYLNDIDYLNTQKNSAKGRSKLVTSKINYYLKRKNDYVGLYFKYFIDTEKVSNDDTLQTLPSVQYHRFSDTFLLKNLLYSIDYKYKNHYRKEGLNAEQNEMSVPVALYFSLFDDYLYFMASENVYLTHIDYSQNSANYKNGSYIRNYHKFTIGSDLSKKYNSFFHTLHLNFDYIVPSFDEIDGYIADFISLNTEEKSFTAKLAQFFYNNDGLRFLTHRMSQPYYFSRYKYKYGDLENELKYTFSSNLELSNILTYSHQYSRVGKIQTSILLRAEQFDFNFMHTYQDIPTLDDSNFLSAKIESKFFYRYNIFAKIEYDFKDDFTKEWEFGWKMKKRCWDYTLSYKEQITPKLTSEGSDSIERKGIYFTINLNPIGGTKYKFEKEEQKEKVDTDEN
jgi:LPS-assembly protein